MDIKNSCESGGALKSLSDDSQDCIFENLSRGPEDYYLSKFPEEYDMRKNSTLPRNQGKRLTCAAFAVTAMREIKYNRDRDFDGYMSPEFIYFHRKNKPASGMFSRDVFQILREFGSLPEVFYPYAEIVNNIQPPTLLHYKIASRYKIANFARITTVLGLKRALLELGPCYIQLPLYETRPYFWRKNNSDQDGDHSLTVVGYCKDGFILKNSWGPFWNGDGHVIFPFNEWNLMEECWVAIDNIILDDKSSKFPKKLVKQYARINVLDEYQIDEKPIRLRSRRSKI